MPDLLKDIEKIVGAEHVRSSDEAVLYAVDGQAPRAAVLPGSADEVGAVLAVCNEAKTAVVPWGGGTSMGLGARPARVEVAIDFRRLNRVIDHEPEDMTSTVQPGITLERYQEHLGRHGQFLALDAPHPSRATIGGVLAASASGPRRLRYGTARDLLIGIRVAHPDGTITKAGAKVVKNVTGYDMNKLYVGSLGTLGLIVEATFRVHPRPPAERTWIGRFGSLADATGAAARVLDSPIVPSALELLNATAAHAVDAGSPETPAGPYLLAVAVASVNEAVDAQLASAQLLAGRPGRIVDGADHDAFWTAVRDFSTEGAVLKVSVPVARIPDVIETTERLAKERPDQVAIVSDAGSGIVRCYLPTGSDVIPLTEALRSLAAASRGSAVLLQAPPDVKQGIDVWGAVKGLEIMRGLKMQFDPAGILNPGRFVGGI